MSHVSTCMPTYRSKLIMLLLTSQPLGHYWKAVCFPLGRADLILQILALAPLEFD